MKVGVDSLVKLGQHAPARRAGARQHRLDVDDGQDDRAQDRDQESARPAQDRGDQQNGDVYVSIIPFVKDVNVGPTQLQPDLDRLDRLGGAARQLDAGRQRRTGLQLPVDDLEQGVRMHEETDQRKRDHEHGSVERHLQGLHLPQHRRRQQEPAQGQRLLQWLLQQHQLHRQRRHAVVPARLGDERPQYLERLRRRPRQLQRAELQQLRYQRHGADHEQSPPRCSPPSSTAPARRRSCR